MDVTTLVAIVGLLVSLSVASERLVEIIKNVVPFLRTEGATPQQEGVRRACLQILAVAAGIVTAFLARPAIPANVLPSTDTIAIVALGLLASGGSAFWNSILSYVLQVKDLKKQAVQQKRVEREQAELERDALKKSLGV